MSIRMIFLLRSWTVLNKYECDDKGDSNGDANAVD